MATQFKGELVADDGEVVARIKGTAWTRTSPGGVRGWGGDFAPVDDELLTFQPSSFTLRLETGSEGRIIIKNLTISSNKRFGVRSAGSFLGNGTPPEGLFASV